MARPVRSPVSPSSRRSAKAPIGGNVKSQTSKYFSAAVLFIAMAFSARLAAQERTEDQEHHREHRRYKLTEIGTFGGPNSYFTFISRSLNNRGVATGMADTPAA